MNTICIRPLHLNATALATLGGALAALTVSWSAVAQADGNYSEWGTPVNLGAVVNSTANDQHPALSKDGLSLYFTSDRPGGFGGLDLWVSQREDEEAPWGMPVNLGATVNSSGLDFAPALSPDGHDLYFNSDRPGGFGGSDIYVASRANTHDDFSWGTPVNLGAAVNSVYPDSGPTIFVDKDGTTTLFFTILEKPGGLGDWDVYASVLGPDGLFGAPTNVVELNSPFRDTRTAIRHDGREMIMTSGRPPASNASADLWVSTRDTTLDPWSAPVNLGDTVNTAWFDGAPALSWDGRTLLFYSNRPGGIGGNDLWMTTRTHLAKNDGLGGGVTLDYERGTPFHRGDPNLSGATDISDGIAIFGFLFLGDPGLDCKESADANNDGAIDISDGIYLLSWLFTGGPEPAAPGPTGGRCGLDPDAPGSPGDLGCESYRSCN